MHILSSVRLFPAPDRTVLKYPILLSWDWWKMIQLTANQIQYFEYCHTISTFRSFTIDVDVNHYIKIHAARKLYKNWLDLNTLQSSYVHKSSGTCVRHITYTVSFCAPLNIFFNNCIFITAMEAFVAKFDWLLITSLSWYLKSNPTFQAEGIHNDDHLAHHT